MEIYLLVLFLAYAVKSLAAMTVTPNAACLPRLTAVPVDDPSHTFFPYFVELHRCSGSYRGASPNIFQCIADKTEDVVVKRFNTNSLVKEEFIMKNHTSCKAECTVKKEKCLKPNVFDPDNCTCKCPHKTAPIGYLCDEKKSWYQRTCSCQCKKHKTCPKRFTWDPNTCECVCKPKRRINCTSKGGLFNEETCRCTDNPTRPIKNGPGEKGQFIESRTFWLYVLAGEFLVLVLVFDMVLYCKKSGMIYSLTKACRKDSEDERQSIHEAVGDGEESCKTEFSSLRSIPDQVIPPPNRRGPINMV